MASTLVALQTVTVGAGGVSSITFSSIPQTYNDLVIKYSARSTSTDVDTKIAFNGITTGQIRLSVNGDGAAAPASYIAYDGWVGNINGSGTTANTFGSAEITIPNYGSSNVKSYLVDSVTENNGVQAFANLQTGIWNNTNAITSITVSSLSGTMVYTQYSTFTLYGVYKDAAETTPAAPTIGTATAGSQAANVAFTPAGSGAPASSYVVTSSPGGLTATGASSPIQIGGLTSGTAYTFTVAGQNPGGVGASSAASNSVTPYDGYESIATVIVGSGGSSTVSFTSIPGTYTHLQIRALTRDSRVATNSDATIRFNGDTAANYNAHNFSADGTTIYSGAYVNATNINIGNQPGLSATASIFGGSVIDILDYANTNKFKTVRCITSYDANGSGWVNIGSGTWRSTSAITSITFTPLVSPYVQYSTFELFGIRG